MAAVLRGAGYHVTEWARCAQASDAAEHAYPLVGSVVIDLDSLSAKDRAGLAHLRAIPSLSGLVMVTTNPHAKVRLRRSGDQLLIKPFGPESLAASVRRALPDSA